MKIKSQAEDLHQKGDYRGYFSSYRVLFSIAALIVLSVIVFAIASAAMHANASDASQAVLHCNASGSPVSNATFIKSKNILCLHGQIDPDMASKVSSYDVADHAVVVLDSPGGSVESALDIAEYLQDRHVSIVVSHYCLSSCANYIFTVGNEKQVLRDSYLGFHGGPSLSANIDYTGPAELYKDAVLQNRIYTAALLRRQSALFARSGVSESLMDTPLLHDGRGMPNPQSMFWEYGPSVLSGQFGVKGIKDFKTPDDASLLSKLAARMGGIACKKVKDDVWRCKA